MVSCKWLIQVTRKCGNWHIAQHQMQQKQLMIPKQTFTEYQNSLPMIIERGLTKLRCHPELCERLKRLTEYNVVCGKQLRGLLTISSCQALTDKEFFCHDDLQQKVFALAWAVEMLHAYFLITDDMEDGAKTRRGRPCWHLLPDVKAFVVNDVGMFRGFINEILKQYFGKEDVYPKLLNIFNDAYLNTHIGQFKDTMSSTVKDYSNFTMERYITTVKYKTAFYSFQFPILLGLALSNKGNEDAYRLVETLCLDVGLLLQMKNDFLDLYEDESVGGKSGTDIQEGKCSWLSLTALKHCSQLQRKEFEENYGKWEQSSVNKIRALYNELNLPKIFANEQKYIYQSLCERVIKLPKDSIPPSELFTKLVNMVGNVGNIKYENEK
ncbi:unnamed protein product, partial [Iphiclides podalirius]